MQTNVDAGKVSKLFLDAVELSCSWCGTDVPLPAGDFSGVCIDCGTVMFRSVEQTTFQFAPARCTDARGRGEAWMTAPAVGA